MPDTELSFIFVFFTKTMKIYTLFLIGLGFLLSCNNGKKEYQDRITAKLLASGSMQRIQDSAITVINHEKMKTIPFREMKHKYKDIRYIPFYSKKPIGDIKKLIIFDKYVIVLDSRKAESIFIFDLSGNLLHIIADKGGGPREYYGLADMSISKRDSLIVINDRLAPFMLYYTLDGKFVKKTKAAPCFWFETFNDKIVNLAGFGQSFSHKMDENFNLIVSVFDSILYKSFPHYPLQVQTVEYRGLSFNYRDDLLYYSNKCDTIYQVLNDSTYTARFVVDQKKSLWQKRNEKIGYDEQSYLVKELGYTYLTTPILETEHFFSYRMHYGSNGSILGQIFHYNKRTGELFTRGAREYPDDGLYISNVVTPGIMMTVHGNYFVGVFDPDEIDVFVKMIKNDVVFENEELSDILRNKVTDELEFILVMYELQE